MSKLLGQPSVIALVSNFCQRMASREQLIPHTARVHLAGGGLRCLHHCWDTYFFAFRKDQELQFSDARLSRIRYAKKKTIESKSLFLFDCNLIIHINFILLRHRINLHELITKAYYNSMVTLLSNSNTFHTSANVHFLPRLQSISPIHWGNYRVWAERTAIANNHGWSLRINHRGRY